MRANEGRQQRNGKNLGLGRVLNDVLFLGWAFLGHIWKEFWL
jgi:hypothetical protein